MRNGEVKLLYERWRIRYFIVRGLPLRAKRRSSVLLPTPAGITCRRKDMAAEPRGARIVQGGEACCMISSGDLIACRRAKRYSGTLLTQRNLFIGSS